MIGSLLLLAVLSSPVAQESGPQRPVWRPTGGSWIQSVLGQKERQTVTGPSAKPEENARLVAVAILHLSSNVGGSGVRRTPSYRDSPLSNAERSALDRLMRRKGVTRYKRTRDEKPFFLVSFRDWVGDRKARVRTRFDIMSGDGVNYPVEGVVSVLFQRRRGVWTLNPHRTEWQWGE